jgi:hypothetical protein
MAPIHQVSMVLLIYTAFIQHNLRIKYPLFRLYGFTTVQRLHAVLIATGSAACVEYWDGHDQCHANTVQFPVRICPLLLLHTGAVVL